MKCFFRLSLQPSRKLNADVSLPLLDKSMQALSYRRPDPLSKYPPLGWCSPREHSGAASCRNIERTDSR